jgi:flagellar protein FliS
MYNSTFTNNKQNRLNQYLRKEIMEATPQQLLIKVLDFAIINCQKKDMSKTNNALQLLINSLRFDTDEIRNVSTGLLKLYQFCQEEMRQKNYDSVYKILTELRETWLSTFNR